MEFVLGVLCCAAWALLARALRVVKSKLQTKKEQRSLPKDRCSRTKKDD
jgi:hypothetical protein